MTLCLTSRKLLRVMLRAAGAIVGPDIQILYYVRNHNKIADFIFDPEKSVVLFSHPTQPTHEFGGPGQAQNGFVKRAEIFILKGRELFSGELAGGLRL